MFGLSDDIDVEVVFALPESQSLISVSLPDGSTVADAIESAGEADRFPDMDTSALQVGIWGHIVARDHALKEGDRVEIYRPLDMDPREARRQLAEAGRTMSQVGE